MRLLYMGLLMMICNILGCNAQSQNFKSLTVDEYAKVIEDSSVVRLDVRTAKEFADGHIVGALNIDVLQSDFESKALSSLPKDKTIAVNCRSGRRSKNAANILAKNDYNVVELDAGYTAWVKEGMPVTKE